MLDQRLTRDAEFDPRWTWEIVEQMRDNWVQATLQNGGFKGTLQNLTAMYSEPTHFIFELLQNAEDKGATSVEFQLNDQSFSIVHDAPRQFQLVDVWGITGIGSSEHVVTDIGRFGMGFKSVYAYTDEPIIESGEYHFKIENALIPRRMNSIRDVESKATEITLPFRENSNGFREIRDSLKSLSVRTLLFLRKIKCISWSVNGVRVGCIECSSDDSGPNHRKVILSKDISGSTQSECWLVFTHPLNQEMLGHDLRHFPIEIAFQLKNEKVVKCDKSELNVFFPLSNQPTYLGFLVQGPFSTTTTRETLAKNEINEQLLNFAVERATDALMYLAENDYLATSSYRAFPIETSEGLKGNPIYLKFFDAFKKLFSTKQLLPAHPKEKCQDGVTIRFADLQNLLLTRAETVRALFPENLARLLLPNATEPKWFLDDKTDRTEGSFRSKGLLFQYVTDELQCRELDSKEIYKRLTENDEFLDKLDSILLEEPERIEWFQKLYTFLSYIDSDQELKALRRAKILYLEDGTRAALWDESSQVQVYIQRNQEDTGHHILHHIFLDDSRSKNWLKDKLGVPELGENARVKSILDKYYSDSDADRPSEDVHINHLRLFMDRYEDLKDLIKFSEYRILQSSDGEWKKPREFYVDEPIRSTGLSAYFRIQELPKILSADPLNPNYADLLNKVEFKQFLDFAEQVGLHTELKVERVEGAIARTNVSGKIDSPFAGFIRSISFKNILTNIGTQRITIDESYDLPALDFLLERMSVERSALIWDTIISLSDTDQGTYARTKAIYEKQQGITRQGREYADSVLLYRLKHAPWVPQKNDDAPGMLVYVTPSEAKPEKLPDPLDYDPKAANTLLSAMGFNRKTIVIDDPDASEEDKDLIRQAYRLIKLDGKNLSSIRDLLNDLNENQIQRERANPVGGERGILEDNLSDLNPDDRKTSTIQGPKTADSQTTGSIGKLGGLGSDPVKEEDADDEGDRAQPGQNHHPITTTQTGNDGRTQPTNPIVQPKASDIAPLTLGDEEEEDTLPASDPEDYSTTSLQVIKKGPRQLADLGSNLREREVTVRELVPKIKSEMISSLQMLYEDDESRIPRCQMCMAFVPFKKNDGNWFFEATFCLPKLEIDGYPEFGMCLCPVCHAKFMTHLANNLAWQSNVKSAIEDWEQGNLTNLTVNCGVTIELSSGTSEDKRNVEREITVEFKREHAQMIGKAMNRLTAKETQLG